MVDHFSHAFGVPNQRIMAEYDARTDAVVTRLVATLPPNAAPLHLGQLDEALAERELSWSNVLSGVEDAKQDQPTPSLRHARGITPDDGDGDDEHPGPGSRGHERAFRPAQMHEQEGSWGACAACQNGYMGAAHATCCAVREATRGRDCTAEMEVPGLIPVH